MISHYSRNDWPSFMHHIFEGLLVKKNPSVVRVNIIDGRQKTNFFLKCLPVKDLNLIYLYYL